MEPKVLHIVMRVLAKKDFAPLTPGEAADYVCAVYMQVEHVLGTKHDENVFMDEHLNGVLGGVGYFYYLSANPMTRFALGDKRVHRLIEKANLRGDSLDPEAVSDRLTRVGECIQRIITDLDQDPHPNPEIQFKRDFKRQGSGAALPLAGETAQ